MARVYVYRYFVIVVATIIVEQLTLSLKVFTTLKINV